VSDNSYGFLFVGNGYQLMVYEARIDLESIVGCYTQEGKYGRYLVHAGEVRAKPLAVSLLNGREIPEKCS